ncbi:MAG: hypothetical protein VKL39_02905 [Leptolyngbyaceae bacterium]|nr:hypothetical protein [Leptolyngbyaceae bacterium]
MRPVIVTPPATEPVSLTEAQTHLRISGEADYVNSLITSARVQVERYLNRALITQTWDVYYSFWSYDMRLPYAPVQSVTSVKYFDLDGNEQTLSSSLYWTVTSADPAAIVRKYETTWPELQYGRPDAIVIRIVCGYGAASAVPEPIKHAIKLLMTDMYENRGTQVIGTSATKIPNYITDLIHSYKIYEF